MPKAGVQRPNDTNANGDRPTSVKHPATEETNLNSGGTHCGDSQSKPEGKPPRLGARQQG